LNRDFIKLEAPEVQAMVRFYRRWNPAVVIDCHTTNGSHHRFVMTYDGPRHPAISEKLVSYVRDTLLPDVGKRLKAKTGFESSFYGFMSRDRTKWESYPAQPRYGIQLVGLRGRIGLLSESYTYAPFKDRVTGSREFVRSILEYVAENKDAVRKVLDEAAKPADRLAIAHKLEPRKEITVLGYVENGGKPDLNQPEEYKVQLIDRAEPTAFAQRPVGYLIPEPAPEVFELLQRHGLEILELREDIELDVEAAPVKSIAHANRPFQGHNSTTLELGPPKTQTKRFAAGTLFIRTSQALGRLASFLLEPLSEDGLVTWNKFDAVIKANEDYPVYRLTKDAPFTAGPVRSLMEDRTFGKRVEVAHYLDGKLLPNFNGNAVRGLQWLKDGEHFLQQKQLKLWKVHAPSGRAEPFVDTAKLAKALTEKLKFPAERAESIAAGGGGESGAGRRFRVEPAYTMNPQQTGFLFRERNDLYFAMFDGSKAVRLTNSAGNKELVTFSPNGEWIAFVRDQNLFAVDLATQKERKLTSDGGGKIFNGKADWVYYEEIFDRDYKAFWWSPDSSTIAFVRYDDTPVSPFPVIDHLPTLPRMENTPYPKSGHPNPLAKLGMVAAAGGPVHFAETPEHKPQDTLLLRAAWQPDSKEVLFYLTDRAQTWLDVMSAPVTNSEGSPVVARKLFRETTKAFVSDPHEPHFLSDGRFLFNSERDGWEHLYLYSRDGKLIRRVTEGPWEVTHVHRVDEKTGRVYFTATPGAALGENLYIAALAGDKPLEALTRGGEHRISMSPTGSYFIDTATTHRMPTQLTLKRVDGEIERRIDTNPVYAKEEYNLGRFDLVRIPLKDGAVLEGSILLPPDFDPKQKYPVWLMTYGGPHAPQVHDAWSFRTLDHVLASLGIIVFHCDPRSASGKGAQATWTAYKQMGVQEAKDIDAALDWLIANHPWVDAAHIGMSGSSYGGFLTAFCLTHSKKFAAGIATAPVTDWQLYDSVYTERYMDTPKNNPKGYEATSVVRAAKDLHGRLLLVHGLMDDNVHVQNSVKLIEALQQAGKQFEIMVYPTARHGVGPRYARHYNQLTLDFIRRTMER
jgi:dipeptidyl aminopeptidase/acylaminoacyl peptidase